ncbi:MAG: FkbM family methyltransferase [Puia sp.]|nr:FkbM family methyltransferase [Puia sp.]
MIATLARWLIRMQCYYLSGIILTLVSKLAGSGCQISYDRKGYWKHRTRTGVIINEAFPNIRMDMTALEKFNDDIYFFAYQPQEGDLCLDIGAGIGTETISLSKRVGALGKIYAVEASPFTYKILEANVLENNLKNVELFNLAISDRDGKLTISDHTESHISNSVMNARTGAKTNGSATEVDACSMDNFIRNNAIARIDYLKVNIEGAEQLLIRDFKQVANTRHLAISCHDFLGRRQGDPSLFTREAVSAFLQTSGFRIETRNTGTDYADDWIYGVNER